MTENGELPIKEIFPEGAKIVLGKTEEQKNQPGAIIRARKNLDFM